MRICLEFGVVSGKKEKKMSFYTSTKDFWRAIFSYARPFGFLSFFFVELIWCQRCPRLGTFQRGASENAPRHSLLLSYLVGSTNVYL